MLVDNGGNGADIMSGAAAVFTHRAPTDCSLPFIGLTDTLTNGRAVVFDAPLVPTSNDQCKKSGWLNFGGMFKNQGQCVALVVKQARHTCLTERATIGLVAFRNKHGLGPYHVLAMRRCVNQTSR